MSKEWIIQPPWEGCAAAATRWNVAPVVAQILHNRNLESADEVRSFLFPRLTELHPPETLPGATAAAGVIRDAVRRGAKIILYGDYDVDGITGVAILWRVLSEAGANVSFYVPHRTDEGFGLNVGALRSLAGEGAELVVSVDCGITACDVADVARELSLPLIITDHHQPQSQIPHAAAIVHPTVGGRYANAHLSGAGVAFKLAWAVAQQMTGTEKVSDQYRRLLTNALPLVALGTIADVVPLVGENRVLARCGLAGIKDSSWPGVQALLEVAGLTDATIDDTAVGFKIAPRINAAGRMGHARLAIELFTRADDGRAREIALYLDEHNRARQAKQRRLAKQARSMIERAGLDGDAQRAIVLAAEDWHPGIVGIVASGIVERYCKPTVLIALENGVGQGSARSVPRFELHKAFERCSAHLISHGGHAMAAGLKIKADAIPAFTEAFVACANNALSGSALLPTLRIDGVVQLRALDELTVSAIQGLGPFGTKNPKPLLATDWINLVDDPRAVGRGAEHLQLALREEGVVLKGIAFGAADKTEQLQEHRRCRVAFEPIINEFNGRRRVELQIADFKFPGEI